MVAVVLHMKNAGKCKKENAQSREGEEEQRGGEGEGGRTIMDGVKEKQVAVVVVVVGLGLLLYCKETSYTFTRTESM